MDPTHPDAKLVGRLDDVGNGEPEVVDAQGGTLLPGLVDAHVHTSEPALALTLRFGVTTELEMQGVWTKHRRATISENDALADVRSAGLALTPAG